MLEEGLIITLDNHKQYIIVKMVEWKNQEYYYLLSTQKPIENLIVKGTVHNNVMNFQTISDSEEFATVMNMFQQAL
ncbi:MAG: hypothetical protein UC703_00805 [Bacilli bacterium]|nr:hypothetical protein [Bacilli bacterium]